jgi:hypothetical protein
MKLLDEIDVLSNDNDNFANNELKTHILDNFRNGYKGERTNLVSDRKQISLLNNRSNSKGEH